MTGEPSVIVRSSECSAEWLARQLRPLWFGGEHCVLWDPTTMDIHPVTYDWDGRRVRRPPS